MMRKMTAGLARSPGRISILSYAVLILGGAGLLMLPASLNSGSLSFIDALFTSASAVCVTGLTVVDTAGTFSELGRWVLLGLIQTGGIGIMVLSTVFILSLGRRVSMTGRTLIRDTYSVSDGSGTLSLVWNVLKFTGVIEGIGAVILFFRFYPSQSFRDAAQSAVFHAVSAFCNAGFSLFPDSFTRFGDDWIINLDICILIVLGGIGFVVLTEIREKFSFKRRGWSFFSLHTKLVLSTTALLLIVSTGIVLALEWGNTLKGMTISHRFIAALFQAVNARTAGFNTVDIGSMTNETLLVIIILMFIGAAPGSCGGGVKVTTFSTLMLLGGQRFFGKPHPQIFHRRISDESVGRAVSLILISLLVVLAGVVLIQQFEIGEVSHRFSRGMFLELMFEMVSAFGTVGLSTGVTPGLSLAGKALIICMMFIGRLGPLAVAVAVSRQAQPRHFTYANESIMIG